MAGKTIKISSAENNVPILIVVQILAAIAEARVPTMAVTITSTDAEQRIVWNESRYELVNDDLISLPERRFSR